MSLHHFVPPYPTERLQTMTTHGRSRTLVLQPTKTPINTRAVDTNLRNEHLRKVFDIMHLSLLRADGPRAARALRILVRSKEWRHAELWRYGLAVAGLMARSAVLEGADGSESDEDGRGRAESSRQALLRSAEKEAATRRLAYLRGIYRTKPGLRADILADIAYELIALKRYDEAMREIEYVLETYPFRNYAVLHLLAGIFTLQSALHGADLFEPSTTRLAELPAGVRRKAELHFQRTIEAARREGIDVQMDTQARIEANKSRQAQLDRVQREALKDRFEKAREQLRLREEDQFGDIAIKAARRQPRSSSRAARAERRKRSYKGPHLWAVKLAKDDAMPESDIDDETERVSQHSFVSDEEDKACSDTMSDVDQDVEMQDREGVVSARGRAERDEPRQDRHRQGRREEPQAPPDSEDMTVRASLDEDNGEDGERSGQTQMHFKAAARHLADWLKSDAAQRPSTWETDTAHLFLDMLRDEDG